MMSAGGGEGGKSSMMNAGGGGYAGNEGGTYAVVFNCGRATTQCTSHVAFLSRRR